MIRIAPGAWRRFATVALAVLATAVLSSCGSGAVSNDNATAAGTGPVNVSPSSATVYSELPTTFIVSGGSGSYFVASSNQSVVPVASNLTVNSFTVVPADVGSDTPVTLTVRDANNATALAATAALTVKPRTINTVVTITPSSSQSAACGSAVCSGGDAEVEAVLSQAGLPLANRDVRFDVVSGDVRIITSAPGAAEVDSLSGIAKTDGSGTARIRIRALAGAPSQTALLRITDLASGFSQTASVTIASSSNTPLDAQPTTISFTGPDTNTCASGTSADVIVFGGNPPYSISQPGGFTISPTVLSSSGSRFRVGATGQCTTGSAIAIVDSSGASVTVTVTNAPGTATLPAFVVAPAEVTFTDCKQQAGVTLAGGTGNYFASSSGDPLDVQVSGNVGTISLPSLSSVPATVPFDLQAGFSDGQTVQSVTVHVLGTSSC
ncbi:MAG TPA: hypothetical protein VLS49_04890 [Usitatibacter sp.]|nr:hypothetical protein [Usitatibacter sp.]